MRNNTPWLWFNLLISSLLCNLLGKKVGGWDIFLRTSCHKTKILEILESSWKDEFPTEASIMQWHRCEYYKSSGFWEAIHALSNSRDSVDTFLCDWWHLPQGIPLIFTLFHCTFDAIVMPIFIVNFQALNERLQMLFMNKKLCDSQNNHTILKKEAFGYPDEVV